MEAIPSALSLQASRPTWIVKYHEPVRIEKGCEVQEA